MDIKDYCKKLKEYRENQGIFQYLGAKYIILKVIIMAMAVYFLSENEIVFIIIGGILLGYALGVTMADIRRLIYLKHNFKFQKEIIDWDKVNKIINEENSEPEDSLDSVPPPEI